MLQRVSLFGSTALVSLMVLTAAPAFATSFTIPGASSTAQTLGSGSGQTGTVNAAGALTVGGSTVAVTISGNNATLTNLGSITQTGTGRVIRDNTGVSNLIINNGSTTNSTALMQAADADVIQMNKSPASVTLNNYGTMNSLNASAGGSQAVDFNAILSGSNVVNNFATGVLTATEADAVRPGVNGVVNNAGIIKSTTTTGSSSDGVDAQNNSGVTVNNTGTGLIEGARHGITGGAVDNVVTFVTTITNTVNGVIRGDNGSGVNLDGFNANESATVTNAGTIIGNGVTGDGDGVDVDGLVTLNNSGTIKSLNAVPDVGESVAFSEGISVGGGTIINSGTIEGDVAAGNTSAVGRGMTLVGNDITGSPGQRDPVYGNTTVTNQSGGKIIGQTDSGIVVGGNKASGFAITINNNAGGTVQGGGTANAAIVTGFDSVTINNSGTINGSSSGKAIAFGSGNDTLNLSGNGTSVINGSIDGGDGTDTIHLTGTGTLANTTNFESLKADAGNWTVTGTQSYANGVTVANGATLHGSGVTLGGAVTVNQGGILSFSGSPNRVGDVFANGLVQSDPTTVTLTSLTMGVTGAIQASAGDVYQVNGDFFNQSTQNTLWNTTSATLDFFGANNTVHTMQLAGTNLGVTSAGVVNNFSWGTLDLEAGNILSLSGLLGGGAFYVDKLIGFDIAGGIVQNVLGNGFNIYYDATANVDLWSRTYALANGGQLIAFNPVPTPNALVLVIAGLALFGMRRRASRG